MGNAPNSRTAASAFIIRSGTKWPNAQNHWRFYSGLTVEILMLDEPHGTRRQYQYGGCRCFHCRRANAQYEAEYRAAYRLNRPPLGTTIDATVVHATIAELLQEGWTLPQIAEALGYRTPRLQYRGTVRLRTWVKIRRLARQWTS